MINTCSDQLSKRLPFFYGYVMIPVAMMMQICTSPGQTFAISAFTPHLAKSLELSASTLAFAYMLGTLFAAVPLSTVGPLTDRIGLRGVSVAAVALLGATCWCASMVSNFATLFCAFFMLRFLGQGSLSLLSGNSISMWFRSRIGRVSALMSIGGAVAFAWIPEWIDTSITAYGWRETYVTISVLIVTIMLPVLICFHRNRPEDLGQFVDGLLPANATDSDTAVIANEPKATLTQAMRCRAYYILAAVNVFWAMTGTGVVFYLFTLCEDRGLSREVATGLFKTLGMSMLAMQLAGGVLADKVRLNWLLGIGATLLAIGLWFAWIGNTPWQLHGFAAGFGAGQGLMLSVGSVVWVRYFGRKHLGSIRGSVWSLTVAGSGCGPLILGLSKDHFGSFRPAIAAMFAVMCLLSILAWWATDPTESKVSSDQIE